MIKLIGILGKFLPNGWTRILDQERVNYQYITELTNLNQLGVIIIARGLQSQEASIIRNYLTNGGRVLTDFIRLKTLLSDFHYSPTKFRYIIPTLRSPLFLNVNSIDIGQQGLAVNDERPNLYSQTYGKGKIIALPFSLDLAFSNTRTQPKFFYYPSKTKLPYEQVACVSRGELRRLVVNCLRQLLFEQGCYYVHLWYYPNRFNTCFTFRVDTDFSPFPEIGSVLKLAEENKLSFTWFINTRAQAKDLAKFSSWQRSGQDIQLHCFQHNVFPDYARNYANLSRGKDALWAVGIKPIGFAGPFGEWNENLASGLEALDFKYSSEFGLGYDDLPFYPVVKGKKSNVLQIPIHPICVGRLLQAGFNFNEIFLYFKHYINSHYAMREPIMIYDHPHRINQMLQLFDTLFKWIKSMKDIWLTNFTQFMEWWKQRESVNYDTIIQNGQIEISTKDEDKTFFLHIIRPSGDETFIPLRNGSYSLDQLTWTKPPQPIILADGIERIRKGELMLRIKELVNTWHRRLKGQRH
uniref:NodB homology domain-containing protein n=1 Tax=candidate division WOR-3 bacterium TaxID=2052148 RepID=A0A7C6EDN0_UNCW3